MLSVLRHSFTCPVGGSTACKSCVCATCDKSLGCPATLKLKVTGTTPPRIRALSPSVRPGIPVSFVCPSSLQCPRSCIKSRAVHALEVTGGALYCTPACLCRQILAEYDVPRASMVTMPWNVAQAVAEPSSAVVLQAAQRRCCLARSRHSACLCAQSALMAPAPATSALLFQRPLW